RGSSFCYGRSFCRKQSHARRHFVRGKHFGNGFPAFSASDQRERVRDFARKRHRPQRHAASLQKLFDVSDFLIV
ncbi:MAG: hypothetical protein J6A23_05170, partial [Thermoguttaceae bacterium]|nr:hypothetical protein [Thermoguttaceae bacterium]